LKLKESIVSCHHAPLNIDFVIAVGDDATLGHPALEAVVDERDWTLIDRVEIEPTALAKAPSVMAQPLIRDAVVRAQQEEAALFLPFPSDLARPGHIIELVGTCSMLGVPVLVSPGAVPWQRAVLPGLSINEVISLVAEGWSQFAPAAANDVLAAELAVLLSLGPSDEVAPGDEDDDADWWEGEPPAEASPQERGARVRGLRRAVSEMLRSGMRGDEVAVVLNALAVPTMDGRLRWSGAHVHEVPPSRDRLRARARRRRSARHA
jgi:hypothetical protein